MHGIIITKLTLSVFENGKVIDSGNYRTRKTLESWHTALITNSDNNSKPLPKCSGPSLRELNRGGVSFIFLPKNGLGHKGLSMRIKNEMWQRLRFIQHYISMVI